MTKKYNKEPSQIVMNWQLCRGCATIPKASDVDHQAENIDCLDFTLDEDDVKKIATLN